MSRTHAGLAKKLMNQAAYVMAVVYGAKYCSLHVRETNRAARALYASLEFKFVRE